MGGGDDDLVTVPCDGALIDAAMLLGCLDGSSFSENSPYMYTSVQ